MPNRRASEWTVTLGGLHMWINDQSFPNVVWRFILYCIMFGYGFLRITQTSRNGRILEIILFCTAWLIFGQIVVYLHNAG